MQSNSFDHSFYEPGGRLHDAEWHQYYAPHGFPNAFLNGYSDGFMANGFSFPHQNLIQPRMYSWMQADQKPSEVSQFSSNAAGADEFRYPTTADIETCLDSAVGQTGLLSMPQIKHEDDPWLDPKFQPTTHTERKHSSVPSCGTHNASQLNTGLFVEYTHIHTKNTPGGVDPVPSLTHSSEQTNAKDAVIRDHTPSQESTTFKCDECSRGYATPRSLAIHKRSHSAEKPYGCNLCNKRFNQCNVWNMHMKAHAGTKDFVCPLCGKAFSQSGHLFTHMQNHQNIKKHGCDICKKRFIGKGDLIRHQRSHTGEKPFSCCQCTRRFSRKESLKYHLFLHDDVRPHNCPLCAKSYTKISTLKTHFKKVHNVGDLDSFITHRVPSNKGSRSRGSKVDAGN